MSQVCVGHFRALPAFLAGSPLQSEVNAFALEFYSDSRRSIFIAFDYTKRENAPGTRTVAAQAVAMATKWRR